MNSPGSAARRVGNEDNEEKRAEIKALPSECEGQPSGMSHMNWSCSRVNFRERERKGRV